MFLHRSYGNAKHFRYFLIGHILKTAEIKDKAALRRHVVHDLKDPGVDFVILCESVCISS